MLKRYVFKFKCFLNIVTLGEHLIPSGKVFHSVAAAVSINRLPSFAWNSKVIVLLLLGTNDVLFADLRCLLRNSETQKFIQHNTRVKNVQQCYCIKIIKYFNYVIFMYYVMEIEQRLFNR